MKSIQKMLGGAFVAGLLAICGASAESPQAASKQTDPDRSSQQQAVQSIAGKVATIGGGGTAFTLEVTGGERKSMDFVIDKNTTIKGQVRQGSAVTVEYQAMANGQNLAVSVTAQA